MKQRKIIPEPVLMILSIIGIAVFMFYWLKESYGREQRALDIKTSALFEQSIRQLQASKLKLNTNVEFDSASPRPGLHIKKIIRDLSAEDSMMVSMPAKKGMISTINVIRGKLKDSLRKDSDRVMITINETTIKKDSFKFIAGPPGKGNDKLVQFLYNIDSLQEPLSLKEIDSAFHKRLVKEKLSVPFHILQTKGNTTLNDQTENVVTIGLLKPVTYKLLLDNTAPYLIKRIMLPVIFSLLLLGITILAFVLLYRNLVRQRRLGEIKNEFISNISHELKTPVATVGVAIEALKNFNAMQDPQRTREYLDISTNELQRLGLLIDKVLKLSLFEKKEMELSYEELNLQEIVEEVLLSLKLQFEKYHANVRLNATGDLRLKGDRLHLQSVVFNLLDNALKYGKENPVIQINLEEKNNGIVFTIKDNGIGIPPEYREKVFEKFFRVPHGNIHNAKGYGLGLSYVAQVIKKHQGTIKAESQPGKETTFIIHLPKRSS
ncbi:MAG: HAMP domain-containing histidine kinase [Ferruginibacter sp.]|nr:HAMP domain-containing histidine kinase [Ferruginibacter sp.]